MIRKDEIRLCGLREIKYYNEEDYRIKINKKKKKILLDFDDEDDIDEYGVNDIKVLKKAHYIRICKNDLLKYIEPLKKVNGLDFENCNNIRDFNALTGVKHLSLKNCNIIHCNNMNKLELLHIERCKKLKDISMLQNLKELTLYGCKKINYIGELINLKKLKLNTYIEGIHLLKNLKKLIIYENNNKISRRINKLKKINLDLDVIFIKN